MHVQVKHGDHEDGQMHLFQRKVSRSRGAATSAPSVVAALRHRNQKAPPRQTRAERHAAKPRRRSGQVASGIGQVASGIFTKSNFNELMRETFVRKGRWVRPRGSATHTLQRATHTLQTRSAHVANAQRTRCNATHTLQARNAHLCNAHLPMQRLHCTPAAEPSSGRGVRHERPVWLCSALIEILDKTKAVRAETLKPAALNPKALKP